MIENPQNHARGNASRGQRQNANISDFLKKWAKMGFNFGGFTNEYQDQPVAVVNLTFEESCLGAQKSVEYSTVVDCDSCAGNGAKEGDYETCSTCDGSGQKIMEQAFQVGIITCPACSGRGIKIIKPCETCGGRGKGRRKSKVTLTIPPCVSDGTVFNSMIGGDVLTVHVRVGRHDIMMRQEGTADIHSKKKLPLKDVLLGCKVNVRTIHGDKMVTIKECTAPGAKVRLKGCGAKLPNADSYGNHIIHIEVQFPESLTDAQRDKIKEVFDDGNNNDEQKGERDPG